MPVTPSASCFGGAIACNARSTSIIAFAHIDMAVGDVFGASIFRANASIVSASTDPLARGPSSAIFASAAVLTLTTADTGRAPNPQAHADPTRLDHHAPGPRPPATPQPNDAEPPRRHPTAPAPQPHQPCRTADDTTRTQRPRPRPQTHPHSSTATTCPQRPRTPITTPSKFAGSARHGSQSANRGPIVSRLPQRRQILGDDCVLRRADVRAMIFSAFAL